MGIYIIHATMLLLTFGPPKGTGFRPVSDGVLLVIRYGKKEMYVNQLKCLCNEISPRRFIVSV